MNHTAPLTAKPARHTGLIAAVSLLAITLVVAVLAAKPGPQAAAPATAAAAAAPATTVDRVTPASTTPASTAAAPTGPLSARDANFDFGVISMAAGNVSHRYWFRNEGSSPVAVKRIYTSCMCTTATLVKAMRVVGSYGMAGHGPLPEVNQSFAPGEAAYLDVVFDPAAHGPAGLGRTERVVSIESDAGQRLELAFVANVRP